MKTALQLFAKSIYHSRISMVWSAILVTTNIAALVSGLFGAWIFFCLAVHGVSFAICLPFVFYHLSKAKKLRLEGEKKMLFPLDEQLDDE